MVEEEALREEATEAGEVPSWVEEEIQEQQVDNTVVEVEVPFQQSRQPQWMATVTAVGEEAAVVEWEGDSDSEEVAAAAVEQVEVEVVIPASDSLVQKMSHQVQQQVFLPNSPHSSQQRQSFPTVVMAITTDTVAVERDSAAVEDL